MESTVDQAPRFSDRDAIRLARDLFGLDGSAHALPSERDQNFRLATEAGERFVLKIANASERREVLELQNEALEHIERKRALFVEPAREFRYETPSPQLCKTTSGESVAKVEGPGGAEHFVRMLTFVPGVPFALFKPHGRDLQRSLGSFFGTLDLALQDFDHAAAHRDFYWDLRNAGRIVRQYGPEIDDPDRRAIVESLLARFETETASLLPSLRTSVIHNDGNDHNVLVAGEELRHGQVSGVIDFGDMVHTYTVAEVAIAAAYAMLDKADPLQAAACVAAGYHAAHPLTDTELEALFPLISMRLAMSVCIATHQRKRSPDNAYLSITERPAWELLARLVATHPRLAHYTLRHACGMAPCPDSPKLISWMSQNRERAKPIVPARLEGTEALVFDLSVGSVEAGAGPNPTDETDDTYRPSQARAWSELLFGRMREVGARVGIGRYDEARRVYTTEQFDAESEELPERRTIHLGVDLFMAEGTPVHAPFDGTVHSFGNNDAELDYGPTIILEHRTTEKPFYTLYGHLSPDSLDGLRSGTTIPAGRRIGRIGGPPANGGWPPHLHFQIIADLFEEEGNFPGVAAPSRREVWTSVCPDPNVLLGIPAERFPRGPRKAAEIVAARKRSLGPSLSLAYGQPIHVVRGSMQYLYDEAGRSYLDLVNNVCHVGHCHPRVVRAGQTQMAVLNTNTRYLHDNLVEYTERLLATMPDPLSVCFLVCSGSEANELALRMARAHTLRREVITVDGAYHGNTQALIDISPYKFDGPGGTGAPAWVHKVAMPDAYRGPHRGPGVETGRCYAEEVERTVESSRRQGGGVAAFICESLMGCGGQIVLPEGYLREAYRHARAAGAVCIADEVQVGFGRVGSYFWGFETQGVVPDIVTLGKPIGNGHPLAAVVTTREIADSFAGGMEYFNTFGGNPVSCAIGLAVLDVVRDQGLQEHALELGEHWKVGLTELKDRHTLIGDVRGQGLFLGVELVLDRRTLDPAPQHATYIIERMKEHGILVSIDGPLHNVLKLKPPIVITENDVDRVVRVLDKILAEDPLRL
jgi:4-aminobutyrate aminotransferase-like enzyme/Ser/Thr protein kinase RdoA (MazF antagonist)